MNRRRFLATTAALSALASDAQQQPPDFSWAGYRCGEAAIPRPRETASIRDFGAIGDGDHDDSAAFRKAIAAGGVIRIPAGRYKITDILDITKSGTVLRGDGPGRTTLWCPTPLNDIRPDWGATTAGARTSNYSWAGGFVWFRGNYGNRPLATVSVEAERGATELTLSNSVPLRAGQKVQILVRDDAERSLARHLYSDDPGSTTKFDDARASLVSRIRRVDGRRILLERPLRFDIRLSWQPQVLSFEPTVTESGLEDLRFEFPVTPYKGHFTELGYNPVAMTSVADCWVRNIRVSNPDSGPFITGMFNTVDGIVLESERPTEVKQGFNGHHGMYFGGDDNLFTGFDIRMKFIHDLSLSRAAGNVISNGRGVDLSFDLHKEAPYENLYTNIDAGAGTRLWMSGGGADLGRHCAARGTFWNIRAASALKPPPKEWAPASIILAGLAPDSVEPRNLHLDQLRKRTGRR